MVYYICEDILKYFTNIFIVRLKKILLPFHLNFSEELPSTESISLTTSLNTLLQSAGATFTEVSIDLFTVNGHFSVF